MSVERPKNLTLFHRSGVMECPYLKGEAEQQLFAELPSSNAQGLFEELSHAGFRRSHQIIYRPSCPNCDGCKSVRIPAHEFKWSKSWKRVMKRNQDLTMDQVGLRVTREQFELFSTYVRSRHGDGEMAEMNEQDYLGLVLASPVHTTIFEFRGPDGRLRAACLCDMLRDGVSAVYSFFDPAYERDSLGSYMILKLIEWTKAQTMDHVYLGFWVDNSPKMAYKRRFAPLEFFDRNGWVRL
ncbi:arginyltransferase [Aestuariispira insulae]|uniref:Aspartate/glutamate leucyltransferase n=1 Tax=Aestuariispira insulae TaxID=1461337 RepID=A0A3D9HVJ2_9PROT|nr:arginyltransferase [Aestuariispira insulae]RED53401.1 arginine-tRNA-protein transferase [Aestuariispira insulae]